MRIVYLDCFSGISGDMFLGALLDAGVPLELFQRTVQALDIGATLEASRVDRGGISATKLDVAVDGEKDLPREEFWSKQHTVATHDHAHAHEHAHAGVSHSHELATKGAADRTHRPGRSLTDILGIISHAPISGRAKQTASEIFLALGAAEAKVHNVDLEHVHFHEVGAADAIVDIVCAAVGAESLAAEKFIASPLNVGGGTVACAHGVMPIPAPATLELLRDVPVYSDDIQKELVTPTGAAIVKVLVSNFGPRPLMTTQKIGYGAGTRDFAGHSNVLRLTIGEMSDVAASADVAWSGSDPQLEEIVILETNFDDLNPQLIGYIVESALAEGALDAFTTPVQMKKNRPGTVVTILARPEDHERLRDLLFMEGSTLGVRSRRETRHVLARRHETVTTAWGEVRMKVGTARGATVQYAPEYEDCRRIAAEHQVPLKTVMQEAIRLYLDQKHG